MEDQNKNAFNTENYSVMNPEEQQEWIPPMYLNETHQPVQVLLDVSLSNALNGAFEETQDSLHQIREAVQNNERAAMDLQVITFGESVQVLQDWVSGRDFQEPVLPEAAGATPLYEALELAMSELNKRRREYHQIGVQSCIGTIVLVTDGAATDFDRKEKTLRELHEMMHRDKVCIVPVGVGHQADVGDLKEIADGGPVVKALKADDFSSAIRYLFDSMSDLCLNEKGPSCNVSDFLAQKMNAEPPQPAQADPEDDNFLDMN